MKKIVRNKKGFTLIELMAVIVILAVVMLLVANRIGNTSKDAKGRSFYLEVKSIKRNIDQKCLLNGTLTSEDLKENNSSDINVKVDDKDNTKIIVSATEKSKFNNITRPADFDGSDEYTFEDGSQKQPKASFTVDCSVETKTGK